MKRVKNKALEKYFKGFILVLRDPAGIRTQDPYIKSVLLYQLSYGILLFLKKRTQTAFVFVEMFSLIAVQNYDFN